MSFCRRNSRLIAIAVATTIHSAHGQQLLIPRVEQMPNIPFNYQYKDYTAVIQGYDSTTFNPTASYQYPIFWWDNTPRNGISTGFGIPSYVGFPGQNASNPTNYEGVTTMGAVLGASVAGIDKKAQVINGNTYDFVWMCTKFYNSDNGENLVLNRIATSSGQTFWYETFPQIQWYSLSSMYYNRYNTFSKAKLDSIINTSAGRWHSAINVMAGGSTTATPNFNHTAFNMLTMTPIDNGAWTEPDAAAAIGLMQYWAYRKTSNATYLSDAQRCIQFLQDRPSSQNPNYELAIPYGALAAARLNAEQNGNYDVGKIVNWWFDPTSVVRGAGWGAVNDAQWGGYGASGLEAGTTSNYAFAMDSWAATAGLVPMVRYDQRFARGIGKWMLNLVNSSRLFYKETVPLNQQSSGLWNDTPSQYWAYEGVKRDANGLSPYLKGDAHQYWGSATDFAYGSGFAGYLGGIVKPTNDDKILKLDLRVMDFYSDSNALPTYLLFNPYSTRKDVQINVGGSAVDLYDTVSGKFIAYGVSGTVSVPLPADRARVLVYCPAGGTVTDNGKQVKVNGITIDYRSQEMIRSYWDRNGSAAGAGGATPTGTWGADSAWGDASGTTATTGWTSGDVAVFSAGSDATGTYTINVSGTQDISGLWFKSGNVTLQGGSLNLSAEAAVTATSGTHVINSTITGPSKLLKDGAGTIVLGNANTCAGITSIEEGVVRLNHGNALQNSSVDVSVHNGLDLNGFSATLGGLSGRGNLVISGASLGIGGNNADSIYTGSLSGTGQLIKNGSGLTELSGAANSWSGGTAVNAGLIRFNGAGSIPSSGSINVASGAYVGADSAAWGGNVSNFLDRINKSSTLGTAGIDSDVSGIDLTGFNASVRLGSSSSATLSGVFTPQGNSYRVGGGGGTLTIASTLSDNGGTPRSLDMGSSGSLAAGMVKLTAANSYTGGTTISSGVLSVASNDNLGASTGAVYLAGGTLQITGTSFASASRAIVWSGGGVDVADPSHAFTITQNLSGIASLNKYGPGELRLSSSNLFSGLNIRAGAVSAGSDSNLGIGSITLFQGATLRTSPGTNLSTAKRVNVSESAFLDVPATSTMTLSGTVSLGQDLSLIKTGPGTLTLAGTTVSSGALVLRQGTIIAGSNTSFGNSVSTQHLLVGDPGSAADENLTVLFSPGVNITEGRIFFKPYALNGTKTLGGTFTSGVSNYNSYIHLTANGMRLNLTAAAGGQVNLNAGFIGNDDASVGGKSANIVKIGAGTVRIAPGGAYASDYFTGTTTVRSGTLLLGGNDLRTDANCVLGNSDYSQAVQIGDLNTQPTDVPAMLIDGNFTINHNITVNNFGDDAILGTSSNATGTFTGAVSLGREVKLTSPSGGNAKFTGAISGAGVRKVGAGTVQLTGDNAYTGATAVEAGTLSVANAANPPLLTGSGGTDIRLGGKLVFDYTGGASPVTLVRAGLQNGFANGFASGQIRSTTATVQIGLGYRDNGSIRILVAPAYYGDADVDGDVDSVDFNTFIANYGALSGAVWSSGDFDYNNKVNSLDFNHLAGNFGRTPLASDLPASNSLGSLIPEPAGCTLVLLAAIHASMRRRTRTTA